MYGNKQWRNTECCLCSVAAHFLVPLPLPSTVFSLICFDSQRLKSSDLFSYLNRLFAAKTSGAIEE